MIEDEGNAPHWMHYGIQSGLLEPVPPKKLEKRYPIGVIGTRSVEKIREKVSNWGYWNPFRQKN
ncbi:hypothetical protein [Neobacillus sp. 19]|uniref:hypothetical protein n=1 Tax=Neobacillus sp. 19 TaxID=3394458 RepID=UPI003C2F8FCB